MLFVLVLVFVAGLPGLARADLGGFTIAAFHTELTVRSDADVLVEERIDVDFSEARHGIYRVIPVRYEDRLGTQFSLGFRLVSVDDGAGNAYGVKTSNQGRNIQIRIGDPDVTVTGRRTYVLRYLVRDALGRFPDHDEIYWNATGNEWGVPIERTDAIIHLPEGVPTDSIEAIGYAGAFGERSIGVAVTRPGGPGEIRFEARSPLAPMQGLTVDAIWPLGHVVHPRPTTLAARFAADNFPLIIPLFTLIGMIFAYLRLGRDPSGPAATVVRYEAPPGIGPSELGTLMDEKVDLRDITAAIVDLAVRGYLVIETVRTDHFLGLAHRQETRFNRTEKPAGDLSPHEQLLLSGIFEQGNTVAASDLREEFYRHIPKIRNALYERLTQRGYFAAKPTSVRHRMVAWAVFLGGAAAFLGFAWTSMRGFAGTPTIPIVSGILTFVIVLLFSWTMPRRTREGVKARFWGLGFEEFVNRTEGKRLEGVTDLRTTFETLLPYAMALGIAAKLARRFEGIYAQAGPTWYTGYPIGHGFSTLALQNSLASSMASTSQALTASPRSSGSGGGGFSGGGGGGGGGGSW
jgi:uncharacterized membrane protein YgcG